MNTPAPWFIDWIKEDSWELKEGAPEDVVKAFEEYNEEIENSYIQKIVE